MKKIKAVSYTRDEQTWVKSLNCNQHLQPIKEEKRIRLQIPQLTVTAQRKEKKETATNK